MVEDHNMGNAYELYKICAACAGTGVQQKLTGGTAETPTYAEIVCQDCHGDKKIKWGWCTEAIVEDMP